MAGERAGGRAGNASVGLRPDAVPRPVYLGTRAHSSARGSGLKAAQAVCAGVTDSQRWQVNGEDLPFFRLPFAGDWEARLARALEICNSAQRLANMPEVPGLPVFFASSSFNAGRREADYGRVAIDPAHADLGSFAAEISSALGGAGAPWCFTCACTSAIAALAAASGQLRHGLIDAALLVATELENQLSGSGFHGLGLLSATCLKPFAPDGDGLVLGEAVASLVLHTQSEQAAGAWRLAACVLGLDSHSPTGIHPEGTVLATLIGRALAEAQLAAADIELVKVHAAGAGQTDMAELHALHRVFGAVLPALTFLKPHVGHTLGASGLLELVLLLDCLEAGALPGWPAAVPPRHVLLISIGFGGGIGVVVLSKEAS